MSRAPVCALSIVAISGFLPLSADGQAVISTRSGLVHFFEGAVYVAGQPLEPRLGKFASIPEGVELRTEQGRAEVLLTPGVFLRVGENSSIRIVANALSDTRVEVLTGSAIVDSMEPSADTSATLIYKGWNVHQPGKGVYRIDCEPPRLRVRAGEVKVSAASGGAPVWVEHGMELPLAGVATAEKSDPESRDALSDWADGRAESISADNAISANIEDPASMSAPDLPLDSFTYFPMLGFSSFGSSLSSPYGSLSSYQPGLYGLPSLYQPGFYSIYLPGYTHRPLLLGLPSSGFLRSPNVPSRIGLTGPPLQHRPTARPVTPRPLPHGGAHIGGHR
jgi:hypothetical protein